MSKKIEKSVVSKWKDRSYKIENLWSDWKIDFWRPINRIDHDRKSIFDRNHYKWLSRCNWTFRECGIFWCSYNRTLLFLFIKQNHKILIYLNELIHVFILHVTFSFPLVRYADHLTNTSKLSICDALHEKGP